MWKLFPTETVMEMGFFIYNRDQGTVYAVLPWTIMLSFLVVWERERGLIRILKFLFEYYTKYNKFFTDD